MSVKRVPPMRVEVSPVTSYQNGAGTVVKAASLNSLLRQAEVSGVDASTVPLRSRQFSLVENTPKSVARPGSAEAQRMAAKMRNPFFNRGRGGAVLIFIIIVFRNGHIANVQNGPRRELSGLRGCNSLIAQNGRRAQNKRTGGDKLISTDQDLSGVRTTGKPTPPGFSSGGVGFVARSEGRAYWAGRVTR